MKFKQKPIFERKVLEKVKNLTEEFKSVALEIFDFGNWQKNELIRLIGNFDVLRAPSKEQNQKLFNLRVVYSITESIQTLMDEFRSVNFEKNVLEKRDMSMPISIFAIFVLSASRF